VEDKGEEVGLAGAEEGRQDIYAGFPRGQPPEKILGILPKGGCDVGDFEKAVAAVQLVRLRGLFA
jgi:hypothetical protein